MQVIHVHKYLSGNEIKVKNPKCNRDINTCRHKHNLLRSKVEVFHVIGKDSLSGS